MVQKTTPVFLDRIEGEFGVMLFAGGHSVDIPTALLPQGVREGTAMALTLSVDEDATAAGKQQVAGLMDELLKRSAG